MAIARIPGGNLVDGVIEYALFTLDPRGHVTSWNEAAGRIAGYQAGEILGRHFSSFYSEEQRSGGVPAAALATAERNGSYDAEGWRVRKDGSRFMASVLIQPLRDTSGRLTGFAKLLAEISERPRQHPAAAQPDSSARPTGKIVHDYNNALHVVTGGLELLRRRIPESDATAIGLVEMVMQHVQQAVSLTRKFFIAPDSAKTPPRPGQVPAEERATATVKSKKSRLRRPSNPRRRG
jgi:PAS domain S-box-containing protein